MKTFKRKIVRMFFCIEIIVCILLYVCGSHGLQALNVLEKQNMVLKERTKSLEAEVNVLQNALREWDMYPFYKEKIARQELQLARDSDELYMIPQE